VTAPQAGTVGDLSVRVGDRVSNTTEITTIDDGQQLEAYLQVPLDRSPQIRLGLPVQLMDADGEVVATNPITFVAPRVDDATQTVLVKSQLRNAPPYARVLQFVRARVVWRSVEGLTVPMTSVTRIAGQYFCFVAEPGAQGGLVAKQKPIEVGQLIGNDYVVRSGLKAGETLIVSGIQKIGDGAPVRAE
jgi:RND family efflux transporter MFP subunit